MLFAVGFGSPSCFMALIVFIGFSGSCLYFKEFVSE